MRSIFRGLSRVHYQQKHFAIKFITLSQTVLLVNSLLRTISNENHWYNNSLCLNVWEYGISSYSSLMKITLLKVLNLIPPISSLHCPLSWKEEMLSQKQNQKLCCLIKICLQFPFQWFFIPDLYDDNIFVGLHWINAFYKTSSSFSKIGRDVCILFEMLNCSQPTGKLSLIRMTYSNPPTPALKIIFCPSSNCPSTPWWWY